MPRIRTSSPLRQAGVMAFTLMLAGAALPAHAISVNDMVVWSASNKPLRMDIELVDLKGMRLSDISLSVASAAEHERVGLTRPAWADSVNFKVVSLPSGKVIARASSSTSIDVDFVSFLVGIRGAGIVQLQQVASKVLVDGAEPLASPQATSVAPLSAKSSEQKTFVDKPLAKPILVESRSVTPQPAPAPATKAAPVQKAALVTKPATIIAPLPTPVPPPSPEPAELVAAAEADAAEVLADVGSEPTLESLQAERTQLLQQVTDLQTRLTELDQQITALNPDAMPATETPTALAEAETSPAEPVEAKLLGYNYFSNVLLALLALFMTGMIALDRMRASKR